MGTTRMDIRKIAIITMTTLGTMFFCTDRGNNLPTPAYLNPDLPVTTRVQDLISRMTLEEKVSQLNNQAASIDRLNVPAYDWWNECLHGVARAGRATVFPQAIGLAATWDSDLLHRVATAISDEARAKHHEFLRRGKHGIYQGLTFWSPNINLFRDPRWGRGMETYGEDPYLAGQMAVAFIRGLQGKDPKYLKVVATAKHYAVHSGPEPIRHSFDAVPDIRELWDTYMPHFRTAVVEGGAASVMCAYNRTFGSPCCGSDLLLTRILREQWGFDGYVVSDCGAIDDIQSGHRMVETTAEAAAMALKAGCDLCCGREFASLEEAVSQGLVSVPDIDQALQRLFTARFRLGMFDPPDRVPYARIPARVNDSPNHRKLALEAARKSIVLLKNDSRTLPFSKKLHRIAVIGPNADDVEVLLGNYNGIPSRPVTVLDGIRKKLPKGTDVVFVRGCDLAENCPSLETIPASAFRTVQGEKTVSGLLGEYFDNQDFEGDPAFTRVDKNIDFQWWDRAPRRGFNDDNFGVRWTGELVPPKSGLYVIGANGFNGFRVYVRDSLLLKFRGRHDSNTQSLSMHLNAGEPVPIRIEYFQFQGDARMKMLWSVPDSGLFDRAVENARASDAVILVLGLSPRLEGEEMDVPVEGFMGGDRLTLDLPAVQDTLMKTVVRLGKPTALVFLSGSALSVPWADQNCPAILQVWYPGQSSGTAVADVLFGDVSPGGRLPVTFYRSIDQIPSFENYHTDGKTYRYFQGTPLYPFGHGLSYTKFAYSHFVCPSEVRIGEKVLIRVDVANSGDMAGDEVVQVYITDRSAAFKVPIRSLRGFRRIFLEPGEVRTVEFLLDPQQISSVDPLGRHVIFPGRFDVWVGGKQPGFTGNADAACTDVLDGSFTITGDGPLTME